MEPGAPPPQAPVDTNALLRQLHSERRDRLNSGLGERAAGGGRPRDGASDSPRPPAMGMAVEPVRLNVGTGWSAGAPSGRYGDSDSDCDSPNAFVPLADDLTFEDFDDDEEELGVAALGDQLHLAPSRPKPKPVGTSALRSLGRRPRPPPAEPPPGPAAGRRPAPDAEAAIAEQLRAAEREIAELLGRQQQAQAQQPPQPPQPQPPASAVAAAAAAASSDMPRDVPRARAAPATRCSADPAIRSTVEAIRQPAD
eukprot:SAG22_NODE_3669_length_1584_cov_2.862626_2_plen_253_part_01